VSIGLVDEQSLETVGSDDSVIFMSNHRSNMDYLLVTYLTSERTMLSFGVGEWSGIFPVRQLMRSAGGYFIRRDSNDLLYRRALERYVQMATEARVPHAIFPEGALSPDGGMQQARFGLFSYVTK
jgi:glycerol-3-phosphate O-acyltransferase